MSDLDDFGPEDPNLDEEEEDEHNFWHFLHFAVDMAWHNREITNKDFDWAHLKIEEVKEIFERVAKFDTTYPGE